MSQHDRLAQMHVRERQEKTSKERSSKEPKESSSLNLGWSWGTPAERVKITGISIPFFDLVWLMVKLAFAAIPAGIIIAGIWYILASALFQAT